MQSVNMRRKVRMNKARSLGHKYSFMEMTLKVYVLNVVLMDRPMMVNNISKNNLHGGRPHNWAKSFFKIYFRLLKETFGNQTIFSPFNGAINESLGLKNLLASYYVKGL